MCNDRRISLADEALRQAAGALDAAIRRWLSGHPLAMCDLAR